MERALPALLVLAQFTGIGVVAFAGPWPPGWALGGLLAGLALVAWAWAAMPPRTFTVSPEPRADGSITVRGPYRWVRHPMYLAVLLAAFSFTVGAPTAYRATATVGLLLVLVVKARFEERLLERRHPGYQDRMAGIPRLVPGVW